MKIKQKMHTSFFIFLILFLLFIILCGCQQQKSNPSPKQKETNEKKITPLVINETQFEKIAGWLNNQTIIYIKHQSKEYGVYSYQLETGKNVLLFTSHEPIKNVMISPNRKKMIVQTSPKTNLAKLYVLDRKGKLLFSKELESFDLTYDWDESNPNIIAISLFYEDWTFNVFTLNVKDEVLTKLNVSDPFVKWFGKDKILFHKWDKDDNKYDSPLVIYPLKNQKEQKMLKSGIVQFDTYNHVLMTITLDKDKEHGSYHFYNELMKEKFSFQTPIINQFNNWLVPYHDFLMKENELLTFVPSENTSIDDEEGHFKLMQYNIQKKTENVIFNQLPNKPLSCSPNGKVCLYGYQYENLLDIQSKKIIPIVKIEKKKEQ